jgi:hypothetical protein
MCLKAFWICFHKLHGTDRSFLDPRPGGGVLRRDQKDGGQALGLPAVCHVATISENPLLIKQKRISGLFSWRVLIRSYPKNKSISLPMMS